MKNIIRNLLALTILYMVLLTSFNGYFAPAWAIENTTVIIDGQILEFTVQPFVEKGTTMVPFRKTFETLGLEILWDSESQTVTGTNPDLTIKLTVGKHVAFLNQRNYV